MQIIESTPIVLIADEGMVITDGTAYGTLWYLAENRSPEEFYEITKEEYDELMNKELEPELPEEE